MCVRGRVCVPCLLCAAAGLDIARGRAARQRPASATAPRPLAANLIKARVAPRNLLKRPLFQRAKTPQSSGCCSCRSNASGGKNDSKLTYEKILSSVILFWLGKNVCRVWHGFNSSLDIFRFQQRPFSKEVLNMILYRPPPFFCLKINASHQKKGK